MTTSPPREWFFDSAVLLRGGLPLGKPPGQQHGGIAQQQIDHGVKRKRHFGHGEEHPRAHQEQRGEQQRLEPRLADIAAGENAQQDRRDGVHREEQQKDDGHAAVAPDKRDGEPGKQQRHQRSDQQGDDGTFRHSVLLIVVRAAARAAPTGGHCCTVRRGGVRAPRPTELYR